MKVFVNTTFARLGLCLVLGAVIGVIVGLFAHTVLGILVGWSAAALLFVISTFAICFPMSGDATRRHARREDATRGVSQIVALVASTASIAGVAILLAGASQAKGSQKLVEALVAVATVASSWLMIHTIQALRYAGLHHDDDIDGKVDFNEDDGYLASYSDFYYLAFDMGTTFQVSDTSVSGRKMRRHIMFHGLLSYVFGTVIIATVVNVVVTLVGGGGGS